MFSRLGIFPVLAVVMLWATAALASPPVLSHQGRLLDAADQPVNGSVTLIYQIFDVPVGGAPLWTEDHAGVTVTDGLFTVELGNTVPLSPDLFAGSSGGSLYLQIQIPGEAPLTPRLRLGSAPFAVSSTRITGDISTAPGLVVMGDTTTANYATFGERVNAGLHAAGSALASGASRITNDCDDSEADFTLDHSGGATTGTIRLQSDADSCGMSLLHTEFGDQSSLRAGKDIRKSISVVVRRNEGSSSRSAELSADSASSNLVLSDDDGSGVVSSLHSTSASSFGVSSRTIHYGDGSSFSKKDEDCDGISSRLAIGSKGTGAKRTAATMQATVGGSASIACDVDSDGDGLAERRVSEDCDDTEASITIDEGGVHAVRVHSDSDTTTLDLTGKRPGRAKFSNIVMKTFDDACRMSQGTDLDGDGAPETSMTSSVERKSGSIIYLDREGNEVLRSMVAVDSTKGVISTDHDSDDDGLSDAEAFLKTTPTTSSFAVSVKGTGATGYRVAKATADSIAVASSVEGDIDGDDVSDLSVTSTVDATTAKVAIKTKGTAADANRSVISATNALSAVHVVDADSDDDGLEDRVISSTCDGTSARVAIKTKGTGADPNRSMSVSSSTTELGSSSVCAGDLDGDGLDDIACASTVDDSTGQIGVTQSNIQVSMRGRKGWDGTVKGRIAIDENGVGERVRFDSDGDGYLSGHLGLGVSAPVHVIDVSGGAYCDGSNWVNASDANLKENFSEVDGAELLNKIAALTISEWNYKSGADRIKHIGPTAQDFQATFGVGSDGKSISTIDPSGIALAAIKELSKRNADLAQQNAELAAKMAQLQQMVEKLAEQNAK